MYVIGTRFAAALAAFAVSAVGAWRCYLANGGPTGHRFAERFVALGWVVGVRLFLVAAAIFTALFARNVELDTLWVDVSMVVLTAVYFWRLWSHISWVVQHADNTRLRDAG